MYLMSGGPFLLKVSHLALPPLAKIRGAAPDERSPNLSRYILVGAAARVMVTFCRKVGSNFPLEPKSKPAKKGQNMIKSRSRIRLKCSMLCIPADTNLVQMFYFSVNRPTNPTFPANQPRVSVLVKIALIALQIALQIYKND